MKVCQDVHELEVFRRKCIAKETDVEAGWVKDPADLGGETNHGITIAKANEHKRALVKLYNWNGSMRDLTQEMAYYIYELDFWHSQKLDDIATKYSMRLANIMFRWGIKSGDSRPVNHLQRTLNILNNQGKLYSNIKPDGDMGPRTMGAIDSLIKVRKDDALPVLCYMMESLQAHWMFKISEERKGEVNERFSWGWICRCMRESTEYDYTYSILDIDK